MRCTQWLKSEGRYWWPHAHTHTHTLPWYDVCYWRGVWGRRGGRAVDRFCRSTESSFKGPCVLKVPVMSEHSLQWFPTIVQFPSCQRRREKWENSILYDVHPIPIFSKMGIGCLWCHKGHLSRVQSSVGCSCLYFQTGRSKTLVHKISTKPQQLAAL